VNFMEKRRSPMTMIINHCHRAERFAPLFRMKMMKEIRGMGRQCGFPVRMLKNFKRKALFEGQPYIVVAERGYYSAGLKRRVITEILKFTSHDEGDLKEGI